MSVKTLDLEDVKDILNSLLKKYCNYYNKNAEEFQDVEQCFEVLEKMFLELSDEDNKKDKENNRVILSEEQINKICEKLDIAYDGFLTDVDFIDTVISNIDEMKYDLSELRDDVENLRDKADRVDELEATIEEIRNLV